MAEIAIGVDAEQLRISKTWQARADEWALVIILLLLIIGSAVTELQAPLTALVLILILAGLALTALVLDIGRNPSVVLDPRTETITSRGQTICHFDSVACITVEEATQLVGVRYHILATRRDGRSHLLAACASGAEARRAAQRIAQCADVPVRASAVAIWGSEG